jgi:hypothetical protein
MPKQKMTLTQAESLLTQFHQSGLTRKAFAQKHDISLSLFAYWIPLLQKRNSNTHSSFHELTLPPTLHNSCTLTLPSGAKLEFPSAHLTSTLAALFTREASC